MRRAWICHPGVPGLILRIGVISPKSDLGHLVKWSFDSLC